MVFPKQHFVEQFIKETFSVKWKNIFENVKCLKSYVSYRGIFGKMLQVEDYFKDQLSV